MAKEGVPVNKDIIAWARNRAGLTLEEAIEKFPRFAEWESGEATPTYPQLENLADELKLPIAAFFFPAPPVLPPIRESFRTLPDAEYERMPSKVRFMLGKAKALYLNLVELTQAHNPADRFILSDLDFADDISPEAMATRVRDYLRITINQQFAWADTEAALKGWRKALQDVGIFVFKDAFRADDYCGFSLYDAVLPLIYVNNSTTKTRQIFTLFHELAHLLFQTSGIDTLRERDTRMLDAHQRRIEVLCNRFAAHFLVPNDAFNDAMRGRDRTRQAAHALAMQFHVSREVIFRKFLDRGWIDQAEYAAAVAYWNAQVQPTGSGGNYYATKLTYLGREYVALALGQYRQNRIDDAQLAEFLETKPKNVATLEQYFLAGGT